MRADHVTGIIPGFAVSAWLAVPSARELCGCWWRRRAARGVREALMEIGDRYRVVSPDALGVAYRREVAIGRNGVFVILARSERGRVTATSRCLFVEGRAMPSNVLTDCRIEALRVGSYLRDVVGSPVPVHTVLCFGHALVAVGQEVRGVRVVHATRLARVILSTPVVTPLSSRDVRLITSALMNRRARTAPRLAVVARSPRVGMARSARVGIAAGNRRGRCRTIVLSANDGA